MDHSALSAGIFDKFADIYRDKYMELTTYNHTYREFCELLPPGRARVLDAARGSPVLTITDVPAVSRTKGIINLIVVDNRVRFEIDLQSAAENGLNISSKLLDLAASVRVRI